MTNKERSYKKEEQQNKSLTMTGVSRFRQRTIFAISEIQKKNTNIAD